MKTLYKIFPVLIFMLFFAIAAPAQDSEKGFALYNQGDYENALKALKAATKSNPADARGWYYLGLVHLKRDKFKDAEKAFEKSIALDAAKAEVHTGLAYTYVLRNNQRGAYKEAEAALALNPKIAEAHYLLGVVAARSGSYNVAYERTRRAIDLAPNFAPAYLLKSQALISSIAAQVGTVVKPRSTRSEFLKEATADLEKYVSLSPQDKDIKFRREYLESLKYFSDYYERPENQKPLSIDDNPPANDGKTPLKVLFKPRADYSSDARSAGVGGKVLLLVDFAENGKVGHMLVLKGLGFGLDEEALKAARGIRFEPATKDGKPVATVKMIEYTFTIY